jgi:hypothetical protein
MKEKRIRRSSNETHRGGRIIGILQQLAVDGTCGRVTGQNLVDQGPLVDFHPTHIGAAIGRGPYDIVIHIAVCSLLLLLLEFDSYQQPTQAVHGGRNGNARDGQRRPTTLRPKQNGSWTVTATTTLSSLNDAVPTEPRNPHGPFQVPLALLDSKALVSLLKECDIDY